MSALCFLSALAGCTSSMRKLHVGADLGDMERSVFDLSADGLNDFLIETHRALGRPISPDTLHQFQAVAPDDHRGSVASTAHLFSAFHLLRKRDLGVFGLSPATAEALSTAAALPAVIGLVLRGTSGRDDDILPEQELWTNDLHSIPSPPAGISLHVVSSVLRGNGGYILNTLDGMSWSALPDERIEGEILRAANEDESETNYYQVVGHFVVTPLSEVELEGHIAERYSLLPYRFRKPIIMRIR